MNLKKLLVAIGHRGEGVFSHLAIDHKCANSAFLPDIPWTSARGMAGTQRLEVQNQAIMVKR